MTNLLRSASTLCRAGATVLDLGPGKGGEALFLARAGLKVTAVDLNRQNLQKLIESARTDGLAIQCIVGDLAMLPIRGQFDMIVSLGLLHFLDRSHLLRIIDLLKHSTTHHGVHVHSVLTQDNPDKRFPCLFDRGELRSAYEDWDILHYEEYSVTENHGIGEHIHAVANVIARRTEVV